MKQRVDIRAGFSYESAEGEVEISPVGEICLLENNTFNTKQYRVEGVVTPKLAERLISALLK